MTFYGIKSRMNWYEVKPKRKLTFFDQNHTFASLGYRNLSDIFNIICSSEDEKAIADEVQIKPPVCFSDSRELSEAECDRDLKLAEIISSELNDILNR